MLFSKLKNRIFPLGVVVILCSLICGCETSQIEPAWWQGASLEWGWLKQPLAQLIVTSIICMPIALPFVIARLDKDSFHTDTGAYVMATLSFVFPLLWVSIIFGGIIVQLLWFFLSYGLMGVGYYVQPQLLYFCIILFYNITIITIAVQPIVVLTKSAQIGQRIFGTAGILIETFGLLFTLRDIVGLFL
jgi:hypothetical protein